MGGAWLAIPLPADILRTVFSKRACVHVSVCARTQIFILPITVTGLIHMCRVHSMPQINIYIAGGGEKARDTI